MPASAPVDGPAVDHPTVCRHCGEECTDARDAIVTTAGAFCCHGEAVFSTLQAHRLDAFYACDRPTGMSQKSAGRRDAARFAALDDPAVAARLVAFDDEQRARDVLDSPRALRVVRVLLEQLWRFDAGVLRSEVDLLRRLVHVEYRPGVTSLRHVAEQLAALGYEPAITSEDAPSAGSPNRRLSLQLGVAGFAFGNIMLFSIPRYVNGAPPEDGFQRLFDALNVLFALPSSASARRTSSAGRGMQHAPAS